MQSGSISDPEKFYHFEIVFTTFEEALQMKQLMESDDYKGAFVVETPGGNQDNGGDGGNGGEDKPKPQFASSTNGGNPGTGGGNGGTQISFGFTRLREPKTN